MNISVESASDKIVITLPPSIDPLNLEMGLRYFKFIDISSRSQATEEDIGELSNKVKSAMAKPIIEKLKKLDEFKDL
ncbi:MAG: hypothetical protein AAGJ82_03000 [Bacteroidota bacterium]